MKTVIAGIYIDSLTLEDTVSKVIRHAKEKGAPVFLTTPNAHHIVILNQEHKLWPIYQKAWLRVPDGVSLLWAARWLKTPLPGRVNGTDLLEYTCKEAEKEQLRVFLFGGRPEASDKAAQVLRKRHPHIHINSYFPPYGFEKDEEQNHLAYTAIRDAAPDILFIGLGFPKHYGWAMEYGQKLRIPVTIVVGVSFEFIAGIVPRAPRWMQRCGLEWVHRLMVEPKRLWKRYLIGNTKFCLLILRQKLTGKGNQCFFNQIKSPNSSFPP